MSDGPKISVLMAVYNGEKFLKEAVESILEQTFEGFEFIIVDDGSTDKSPFILDGFVHQDERIKLICNEQNLGLPESLNVGLENCQGQYIARMDADDIALPERLEKQLAYFDRYPELVMLGSNAVRISDAGTVIEGICMPAVDAEIRARCLFENPFIHPSMMWVAKKFKEKNIKYRSDFKTTQDWCLWVDGLQAGKAANIQEALLKQRLHSASISFLKRDRQILNSLRVQKAYCSYYLGEEHWNDELFYLITNYFLADRSTVDQANISRAELCLSVISFVEKVGTKLQREERSYLWDYIILRSIQIGLFFPMTPGWGKLFTTLLIKQPNKFVKSIVKIFTKKMLHL